MPKQQNSKAKSGRTAPVLENHRVRVAREKRGRMLAHLFESVLAVCPGSDPSAPAVIDDVVKHAKVSRGTFYKYFSSLEEAIELLGEKFADELARDYALLYEELTDPRLRAATGFSIYLSRAVIEPRWGSFVAHLSQRHPGDALRREVSRDLASGIEKGVFSIRAVDVAVDLVIGAKIQAIRHLIENQSSRRYIETMAGLILRSLGVPPDSADEIAIEASNRLHREARDRITWWRPFK